jgi:hypothetical protein
MIVALYLLLNTCILPPNAPHHFYVSKTIMNYSPDKGTIEITMRFFTDDLELGISKATSSPFKLGNGEVNESTKVDAYIHQHFHLAVNGRSGICNWVGMETEADLTYCYLEIVLGETLRNMDVMNDCLMEIYPEQQNIIDLTAQSTTQTAILVKGASRHSFTR